MAQPTTRQQASVLEHRCRHRRRDDALIASRAELWAVTAAALDVGCGLRSVECVLKPLRGRVMLDTHDDHKSRTRGMLHARTSLGQSDKALRRCNAGSRPVLYEFGSSGDDLWFCRAVLVNSRAAVAARPDGS